MNFLSFIYRELSGEGYSDEELLDGTNLSQKLLLDPAFRTDFLTLKRIAENAMQATRDIHLGPRLATRFEPNFIGPPAYAALNASCFVDGLNVLARFIGITFPMIDFSFQRSADGPEVEEAELIIMPKIALGNVSYFVIGSALAVLNSVLLEMLRQPIVAKRVETVINEPDGWTSFASEVSRVPVKFGSEVNRIVVAAEILERDLPGSDPINHARMVDFCEQLLEFLADQTNPKTRIKAYLESQENLSAPLAIVARETGYSERGLRRQLAQAGTSFRTLKDEIRRVRAEELLLNTNHPVQHIAFELGFDSASNFSRRFKSWTGSSPKSFREAGRV